MNEELKARLISLGLTEDQINAVTELGVTDEADMAFVTDNDLTSAGIKPIAARKIVSVFNPRPSEPVFVPAPAPSTPVSQTIVVQSGRPEDMGLQELLTRFAGGERTIDYLNAIRKYSRNRRVFVRIPNSDILDVVGTMELINFADGGDDVPEYWGDDELPTETLEEIMRQSFFANPITTHRLPKGNAWLKVSEQRRILAAYARIAGHLKGNEDEFTLLDELTGEGELPPRWKRIEKSYGNALRNNDPQAVEAQVAIRWSRKGSSRHTTEDTFPRGRRIVDNIDER